MNISNKRLRHFYSIITGKNVSDKNFDIILEQLVKGFSEEAEEFIFGLDSFRDGRYSNTRRRNFLVNKMGATESETENLTKNIEFLLKFYERKYSDQETPFELDDFLMMSRIRGEKGQEEFYLDKEISLENIENRVSEKVSNYNQSRSNTKKIKIDTRKESYYEVEFDLYKEMSERKWRVFKFRKLNKSYPSNYKPSFGYQPIRQLKSISIRITVKEGETILSFDKDPTNSHITMVRDFFDIFRSIEDDIDTEWSTRSSELASSMQETVVDKVKEGEVSPEDLGDVVRENSEEIVEKSNVQNSEEAREFLEENIKLLGFEVPNNADTGTELRFVTDDFKENIKKFDSFEDFFSSFFDEIGLENVDIILDIDGNEVNIDGKNWKSDRRSGGIDKETQTKLTRVF